MKSRHAPSWRYPLSLVVLLLAGTLLSACGEEAPPEPEPAPAPLPPATSLEWIKRLWRFEVKEHNSDYTRLGDPGMKFRMGVVDDLREVGGLLMKPADVPDGAKLHVYSNHDGSTYWVGAQVPAARVDDPSRIDATYTLLNQYQYFIKNSNAAKLSFKISEALVEVIDANRDFVPRAPTLEECGGCSFAVLGQLKLDIRAYNYDTNGEIFQRDGFLFLGGYQQHWLYDAIGSSDEPLWHDKQFTFDGDASRRNTGDHAKLRLTEPLIVEIPLDTVAPGEMFVVFANASANAVDFRHRDTYAGAFLRDPQSTGGLGMTYTGLTPVDDPGRPLPEYEVPAAPVCTAPNPEAGSLQFELAENSVLEGEQFAPIYVTRSGGSQGRVSARFSTEDDSAQAGTHYTATTTHVAFADGQMGRRLVRVPILGDRLAEADRSLKLKLDEARGCATLGGLIDAALLITDDDRPPTPDPVYTVYVTVTGLAGQGLVIEDSITSTNITPTADGTHALGYPYYSGLNYNVRVHTQPSNPDQSCTVSNGSGTIADADVNNVSVICRTLAPAGALDPTFGVQGKVYVDDLTRGRAVVVQRGGRIVVLEDMRLAAFHADGSVDESFGTSGRESFEFNGGSGEESYGLTIQDDDKLVVVGRARNGNRYDMAVSRFNADGSRDMGFGVAGVTTLNPYQMIQPQDGTIGSAYANRALMAADGKIYVAGVAGWNSVASGNQVNFAAARLNADGTPDTTYAGGVGSTASITGEPDVAYGLGLQSDGKLVLAGHANNSQGVGLARLKTNGALDTDDPRVPENYGLDGAGVVLHDIAPQGPLSGARDLVMLDDDSVVVLASVRVPHPTLSGVEKIELIHVGPDGMVGGSNDFLVTSVGPDNDIIRQLIRQPDGKLLLAAQVSSPTTVADFGIVRYNADLTRDATFGDDGVVLVDFYAARDGAAGLALAPDGGIIVVGAVRNGTREQFGMVRISP